jgi:SAM-dependent methyltransferase
MSWRKEFRNLQWFGLRDRMAILDLGCGPGHFTELLAQSLPDATITALDSDARMLAQARERFRGSAKAITTLHCRAEQTALPGNSFDFAVARLLFQHLSEPAAVVREAMRLLKPGGKLVITDDDDGLFGIVEPPIPQLNELLAKYGEAQARRGGNRRIGRWLPRLLLNNGFVDVEFESVVTHSHHAGLSRCFPQLDAAPLNWLVREGHLTPQERDALSAAHAEFLAAEPFAIVLLFMACGAKGVQSDGASE